MLGVDENGVAWAVPIEWTDAAAPTVEREINVGRAYVLVDDLLALVEMIARMNQ